jgi:hypothetical protein
MALWVFGPADCCGATGILHIHLRTVGLRTTHTYKDWRRCTYSCQPADSCLNKVMVLVLVLVMLTTAVRLRTWGLKAGGIFWSRF